MINPDIQIEWKRPLQNIEPPYGQCDRCHYVFVTASRICPICPRDHQGGYTLWPDPELTELWYDAIAMWNERRVELSAVVAAMYFEGSVFHLIFWGTVWLDPELNWIGLNFDETANKDKQTSKRPLWAKHPFSISGIRPGEKRFRPNGHQVKSVRNIVISWSMILYVKAAHCRMPF